MLSTGATAGFRSPGPPPEPPWLTRMSRARPPGSPSKALKKWGDDFRVGRCRVRDPGARRGYFAARLGSHQAASVALGGWIGAPVIWR